MIFALRGNASAFNWSIQPRLLAMRRLPFGSMRIVLKGVFPFFISLALTSENGFCFTFKSNSCPFSSSPITVTNPVLLPSSAQATAAV
jgi:hypothetical protein